MSKDEYINANYIVLYFIKFFNFNNVFIFRGGILFLLIKMYVTPIVIILENVHKCPICTRFRQSYCLSDLQDNSNVSRFTQDISCKCHDLASDERSYYSFHSPA